MLLDGVAFAIEVHVVYATAGNHGLVATGSSVAGTVGIEGTERYPLVNAVRRKFVLELDVVEPPIVDVEVLD